MHNHRKCATLVLIQETIKRRHRVYLPELLSRGSGEHVVHFRGKTLRRVADRGGKGRITLFCIVGVVRRNRCLFYYNVVQTA